MTAQGNRNPNNSKVEGVGGVSEALSGRELDRALMRAMGYVQCRAPVHEASGAGYPADDCWATADDPTHGAEGPSFSTSVDALAPVEAKLRAAGWVFELHANDLVLRPGVIAFQAIWKRSVTDGFDDSFHARSMTEALARARAALAALKVLSALKGVEGETR